MFAGAVELSGKSCGAFRGGGGTGLFRAEAAAGAAVGGKGT